MPFTKTRLFGHGPQPGDHRAAELEDVGRRFRRGPSWVFTRVLVVTTAAAGAPALMMPAGRVTKGWAMLLAPHIAVRAPFMASKPDAETFAVPPLPDSSTSGASILMPFPSA